MALLTDIAEELANRADLSVRRGWREHTRGSMSRDSFVRLTASNIDLVNGRARVTGDVGMAAYMGRQFNLPVLPVGLVPIRASGQIEAALRTLIAEPVATPRTSEERLASIERRLGRMARNEPVSALQEGAQEALREQGIKKWTRRLNANACPLCRKWADGVARSIEVQMIRHHGCRCIPEPVLAEADIEAAIGAKRAGISGSGILRLGAIPRTRLAPQVRFAGGVEVTPLRDMVRYAGRYLGVPTDTSEAFQFVRGLMRPTPAPTIFDRLDELERVLRPAGVVLTPGQYVTHGSGLLDALNLREAGDLDVIAHPDLYEQIKQVPGWRPLMAGVAKDVEILSNPKLNVQIAKALEQSPSWRRQITIADLTENIITIHGRPFITPELLADMKAAAIREGAKVPKNVRDIELLQGRLTWSEDVHRFGSLLNRSRLTVEEQRRLAALRHPSATVARAAATARAAAGMRRAGRRRMLRPIATPAERRALQRYGRGSFDLNDRLRHDRPLSGHQAQQVELIDRALARQHTPFQVKAYRAFRISPAAAEAKYGRLRPGDVIQDKAFLSTGLRESVTSKYNNSGWLMEIDVPPGTPGYYAPYRAFTPSRTPRSLAAIIGEDELLLPRNTMLRVTGIDTRPDGTRVIRTELIPSALRQPLAPRAFIEAARRRPESRPPRISIGVPTTKAGKAAHIPGAGPVITPDLIAESQVNKTIHRISQVPGFEDFRRRKGRRALDDITERYAEEALQYAEESWALSREATLRHAEWYPFINRWGRDRATETGLSVAGTYAMIAALSPTALWPNNVAWANFFLETFGRARDIIVRAEWIEAKYTVDVAFGRGRPRHRGDLIGKRLYDLSDEDAAVVLRAMHDFSPVRQLGGRRGFGDPSNTAIPQSMENLTKAVSVLRHPTVENIDAKLGGLKVRSFYMNISDPFDLVDQNVTPDTHHFGILHGAPWTVSNPFIKSGTLNITDTPESGITGVRGAYPMAIEGTRRAARRFNELHDTDFAPAQIQSIDWEWHQAKWPSDFRTPENLRAIGKIRTLRARGHITRQEELELVEALRLRLGAPTMDEILEWFMYDLRGETRPSLRELRGQ